MAEFTREEIDTVYRVMTARLYSASFLPAELLDAAVLLEQLLGLPPISRRASD